MLTPTRFVPALLLLCATLILSPAGAVGQDAAPEPGTAMRGMQPADYYRFQVMGDPQISPDGTEVVFVRTTVADDRRSRETSLWLVPTDASSEPRPFTSETSDRSPRWSPDGEYIAFLSGRGDGTQLHRIRRDGGEAEAVTDIRQGSISAFQWLPDSESFLLTLTIDPAVDDPTEAAPEVEGPTPDTIVVRDAAYRTGPGRYLDRTRRTLWLLSPADDSPRRLVADSAWHVHNAQVSPDGQQVAFNADMTGEEFDGGFNQDLHLLSLAGGEVRTLATPAGRAQRPLFAPDGESLLYHHQADRYEPTELHRISLEGGDPEVLHDGMALTTSGVLWPQGADAPFFGADHRGSRPLFQLTPDGGEALLLGERASVEGPTYSREGDRVVFIRHDEVSLPEVWTARSDGSQARALSDLNRGLLDSLALEPLERFTFEHDGGGTLDGFLLRPVGFQEGESYPVVLNIKGGPGGMWGHQWFHENHMLAAAGYGVVFTNYRGSTGWGHEFQSQVRLDYGGVDFRDNMTLVDEVLERFDWIDQERLLVTGGSHGGFLTNWITTRTDRFRAAVTQRSVSNWISEAGTQTYPPRGMNAEFGGSLWENFDYYWDRSPLQFAHRVTTPTLVIHSKDDHITPIGQGQEWFYALKNVGVPTEMVMFEGEGHGLSRGGTPVNLVERLNQLLRWFEEWDR